MGINISIYLPAHVKTEQVFHVIQKFMGVDFIQDTFEESIFQPGGKIKKIKKSFEPLLPASEDNPWHLNPSEASKRNGSIEHKELSYMQFTFQDFGGGIYQCLYHIEGDESDEYMLERGNKTLYPNVSSVWACVGKKLVDFFGGKMNYNDGKDLDDEKNWYFNNNPTHPFKTKEQTSNDYWYSYHNSLFQTKMITSKDILDMSEHCGLSTRDKSLIEVLNKFEFLQKLSVSLDEKDNSSLKKIKL